MALYLASQSPRRKLLLKQIGLSFSLIDISVDEQALPGETPVQRVDRLA